MSSSKEVVDPILYISALIGRYKTLISLVKIILYTNYMRPTPIISRSRSKSPSPMFRSSTPKSKTHILQLRKKVMTASGELVEPKTPPGIPPYIGRNIKRPVIKMSKPI